MRVRFAGFVSLLLALLLASMSGARGLDLGVATLPSGENRVAFWEEGFEVYAPFGNKAIVGFERDRFVTGQLERFAVEEFPPPGPEEGLYLSYVPTVRFSALARLVTVEYYDGENAVIVASPDLIEEVMRSGYQVVRVFFRPLPRPEVSRPAPGRAVKLQEGFIEDILSRFTEVDYRALLYRLQAFVTRYSYADSCRAAEEWAYNYFEDLCFDSELFEYNYSGETWRNAIGTQLGLTYPDSIFIICGHMDAVSENPRYDAPGAEDNASGAAAVLQTATILSRYTFDYTIQYVLFTGEEQGLIGSEAYADWAHQHNVGIVGVLNFDMISYDGGYGWDINTYADRNRPREVALGNFFAQLIDDYTGAYAVRIDEDGPLYCSDHYWFSVYGFPAVFSIDAQLWGAPDFYPWYHSTADTIGNLDTDYGIEVVKGAGITMASLADILGEKMIRVTLAPESPSIMIPPQGGSFTFDVSLTNTTSQPKSFNAWVDVILPDGTPYGPLRLKNVNIAPHRTVQVFDLVQKVPGPAPPGYYRYIGKVGVYPDSVYDFDKFGFAKQGGYDGTHTWALSDWSIEEAGSSISGPIELVGNFPNPFNAATVITYYLPGEMDVKLEVYNLAGQRVATLVEGRESPGLKRVSWDAGQISSGVYFAKLSSGPGSAVRRMLLVK
jgi:hypothetical protein